MSVINKKRKLQFEIRGMNSVFLNKNWDQTDNSNSVSTKFSRDLSEEKIIPVA